MAWILHLAFLSSSIIDSYRLMSEVAGDDEISVPRTLLNPSASGLWYQLNLSPVFDYSIGPVKDNVFPAMADCDTTIWDITF